MISVVVLTHSRRHLLQQCVERVLLRTSDATGEIVIWNNGSLDDTADYLDSLEDSRIRVITHPENIGMNAYRQAVGFTTGDYIVELDDDVTDAPAEWDAQLLDAFRRLPDIGYLSADLAPDPNDEASRLRHEARADLYSEYAINGVALLDGPTGGGCAMTSRAVYERVGGFEHREGQVFWQEDAAYGTAVQRFGYRIAVLRDLQVKHTGGPYYAPAIPEKARYWKRYARSIRRKNRIKRVLLLIPFVSVINRWLGLFRPPSDTGW